MKKILRIFKTLYKNLKAKYKELMLVKIIEVKRENKYLSKELQEQVLEKQKLYDLISVQKAEIRELRLKYEEKENG